MSLLNLILPGSKTIPPKRPVAKAFDQWDRKELRRKLRKAGWKQQTPRQMLASRDVTGQVCGWSKPDRHGMRIHKTTRNAAIQEGLVKP